MEPKSFSSLCETWGTRGWGRGHVGLWSSSWRGVWLGEMENSQQDQVGSALGAMTRASRACLTAGQMTGVHRYEGRHLETVCEGTCDLTRTSPLLDSSEPSF